MTNHFICLDCSLRFVLFGLVWLTTGFAGYAQDSADAMLLRSVFNEPVAAAIIKHIRRCGTPAPDALTRGALTLKLSVAGALNGTQIQKLGPISVPVYFHVLTRGEVGTISDQQIRDQISVLNSDYHTMGINFNLRAITRTDVLDPAINKPEWFVMHSGSAADLECKTTLGVNSAAGLNLYSAMPTDPLVGAVLGYATFPWDLAGNLKRDGVVLAYNSLPRGTPPYNLGKTGTHEIGHWLGLFHRFEFGGTPFSDGIDENPAQPDGDDKFVCKELADSDAVDSDRDPARNFMNYADDHCLNHFTDEQRELVRLVVSTYRPQLLAPSLRSGLRSISSIAAPKVEALVARVASPPARTGECCGDNQTVAQHAREFVLKLVKSEDDPRYAALLKEAMELATRRDSGSSPAADAFEAVPRVAVPQSPAPSATQGIEDTVFDAMDKSGRAIDREAKFRKNVHEYLAKRPAKRIICGEETELGEYPDCVAVGSGSDWCCSGTLIGSNIVVTAGHCHKRCPPSRVFFGNDVKDRAAGEIVEVIHSIPHESFNDDGKLHNDLTILILKHDVGVEPRRIANTALIDSKESLRIVGFGRTDVDGVQGYGIQRFADVVVADDRDGKFGSHRGEEIVAGMLLLLRDGCPGDSCAGDSGGPAYIDQDGQWFVAAATSRGVVGNKHVCGDGGIYVRLDKYRTWLRETSIRAGGHWKD